MDCGALAGWDRTSENMLCGFSKEGSHVSGPIGEQFIWDLAGGFSLRFEDLTITWRCLPVYSITWVLLLMTASVGKELAPSTAQEGPHRSRVATALCQ